MKKRATYKGAGVDIESGKRFIDRIKPLAEATYDDRVVGGLGGFSGFYSPPLSECKNPLLVSAADGVGTKLRLAFELGFFNTIGIDLVAMCVNDIVTTGARPLFFLDYLATSKLDVDKCAEVVKGIAEGCKQARCALIGGETAEMPGFYHPGEFDLAGFAVGMVDAERVIDGSLISPGDKIIGLASSGLHSNGYSLARKVIADSGMDLAETPGRLTRRLGETMLEPTRIYARAVIGLTERVHVHGLAHITGGGLIENIPRVLPDGCAAALDSSAWKAHTIFQLIMDSGGVEWGEMYRTFNCGVGMAAVVSSQDTKEALSVLESVGEEACVIGEVTRRGAGEPEISIS